MSPSPTRKRHDREEVLLAAEGIVDRDGWMQLTMTALANELGVKVPSLYNHVPNLEALRGELQNRALRDIGVRAQPQGHGPRRSNRPCGPWPTTFRRFAKEHPGRYDLAMQAPVDLDGVRRWRRPRPGAPCGPSSAPTASTTTPLELQLSAFAALHGVLVLEQRRLLPPGIDTDAIYEHVLGLVLGLLDAAAPDERQAG